MQNNEKICPNIKLHYQTIQGRKKRACNNKAIKNKVDRHFDDRPSLEACVSDLTFVKVGNDWNYICSIIDLHNREIIGFSVGKKKSAQLVKEAI